jgi:aerobic carbon-monoxide dehydrogenase large subunit
VEVTAGPTAGDEHATVEVHPDGSATVLSGSSSHGQGLHTAFAMIASEQTGIPLDRITVVQGDTDRVEKFALTAARRVRGARRGGRRGGASARAGGRLAGGKPG